MVSLDTNDAEANVRVYISRAIGAPRTEFAIRDLRGALERHGIAVLDHDLDRGRAELHGRRIIIRELPQDPGARFRAKVSGAEIGPEIDESFEIRGDHEGVTVEAATTNGLMYGVLELAEIMDRNGWPSEAIDRSGSAAIAVRGIKINLPFEAYAPGEPFERNESHMWSMEFWGGFIDLLARSRYNLLTLWSQHPWHLLVASERFRDANRADDEEMSRRRRFFDDLLQYADDRGIAIVLFSWNICLTSDAAEALGVPDIPHGGMRFDPEPVRVRQHLPLVREYIEEMVYLTLVTYPLLRGIGTTASETMVGSARERQQWVADAYANAYDRAGRRAWFIQRTNMQGAGGEIKEIMQPRFPSERFFISWKYANAHAYSHPEPQFERLWNAWEGVDLDSTNVMFTVRNDDINTHRWSDPEFVRAFVRGMRKPYVRGFYWGSDAYVFGRDFQHVDHGHKTWQWDYERHALQFQLWGRLSFDPDAPADLAEHLLRMNHGEDANNVADGLAHASRIIPAVNRILWRDYDYMWHPESCLSRAGGFRTVVDFMAATPMPGLHISSIADEAIGTGASQSTETPSMIVASLQSDAARSRQAAGALHASAASSHSACVELDLRALAALGEYYAAKISAAVDLVRCRDQGDVESGRRAIASLQRAVGFWEEVGRHWGRHYRPYDMTRVGRTFGYPYYLDDVEHDVTLANEILLTAQSQAPA